MAAKSVAFDPGSHTGKVLALADGKNGLKVTAFATFKSKQQAQGLHDTGIPLKGAVAGVAGRDMTLRYTQVPPAPDWQLRNLMELEIADLSSQSGDELSADYNLLPATEEDPESDTILMALARNEALDRVSDMVRSAGGDVSAHVPNCVAIYNAYLRTFTTDEDQVVCIANIGHETVDIAIARGQDLMFARNLSGGGKVLDDAIAAAFNVSGRKAENLKRELLDLDPASRGKFASGQAEKVSMAAGGSATMLVSAIQSSVAFCKTQTKQPDLRLDLILLCGGSARLRGIRGLLREALHCPVELFDPFATVDLSALTPSELEELDRHRSEAVVALGLAATALDDSLYSLEILPEAVKRRQRFVQRTVYNILAALVLIGLLIYASTVGAKRVEAVAEAKDDLNRAMRSYKQVDKETAAIVQRNKIKASLVNALVEKSVPFDGTLRVLRAMQEETPEDIWLQTLEIGPKKGTRIGERRLGVNLKGHAKEVSGKDIQTVYRDLYSRLKKRKDVGEPSKTEKFDGNKIEFAFFFDVLPDPAKPEKEGK